MIRLLPHKFFVGLLFLGCICLHHYSLHAQNSGKPLLAKGVIDSLNQLALRLVYSNPDTTLLLSQKAYDLAVANNNTLQLAASTSNMAKAFYIKGAYTNALKAASKALELSNLAHDTHLKAMALNNIGLIYMAYNQFDKAIIYFTTSINISLSTHDSVCLAVNYFDMGICLDETKQFSKSTQYLYKAIAIDKGKHISLMAENRLGESFFHSNNYQKATTYYRSVLADERSKNDNWEKAFAYQGLAQTHYALNHTDSAIFYATISLEAAQKVNAKWDAERAAKILAQGYATLHNFEKAYTYLKLNKIYNDSLYIDSRDQVVGYLKLQQAEKDNVLLQKKAETDKKVIALGRSLIVALSCFALFVVIVAVIIYRLYYTKKCLIKELQIQNNNIFNQKEQIAQQNNALITSNQVKDQLFSILSHDLKSPMFSIQQALEIIAYGQVSEEDQKYMFESFYKQVAYSNQMLNNLLQWVTTQRSGFTTKKVPVILAQILIEVLNVYRFLALQKNIILYNNLSASAIKVYADTDQLRIIIQNLVGNAIKFTRIGGEVHFFEVIDTLNNTVTLHFKDNGLGIPANTAAKLITSTGINSSTFGTANERGTGLGLFLVKQFVEQNSGQLHINSQQGLGTDIGVQLPLA